MERKQLDLRRNSASTGCIHQHWKNAVIPALGARAARSEVENCPITLGGMSVPLYTARELTATAPTDRPPSAAQPVSASRP